MRLKKHTAVVAFQSQLSAILEKLMVLAVEEIKELVLDLCEEISHEQTTKTTDASEATRKDEGDSVFHTTDTFFPEPQDGHDDQDDPQERVSQPCSMEDEKESQNYMKFPNAFSNSSQEAMPDNCKFEVASTVSKNPSPHRREEDCSRDGSRQSSFEPEDTKSHLPNYNFPDETQCSSYDDAAPTNQDHSRDVVFQIKQEEETPGFETGMQIDAYNSNVEQGINFDSFGVKSSTLNSAEPVLDLPSFSSLQDLQINIPMYVFSQTKQNGGHSELRLPPSKQVQKYSCDFCNKRFCYPSDLKFHRLWHTRERTHVCQICGKAFITRSHLRRHEAMHGDKQPSVCHLCGYKTSRMVYMNEHMKTHKKM
uniref:C2H2-type domain-containing protein n=1 Tax=Knipowitschia caucasica TaxID=637954 RepID=A0AAV2LP58_KNICA